ncbi:MAG: dTDP-4-dehydrorhamnose reductase [Candidatus Omnitrophica bacterium]|nr:dTDP-4-dehydrorhamnose reductase [Candidatus Omnitrophota bacterium]
MKILITGGKGMVGGLLAEFLKDGNTVHAPGREELDITDREKAVKAITDFNPDILFHCAAFTDVDGCENERKRAYLANALGTQHVAEGCAEAGSKMVYLSTDFVFDGKKGKPYSETDNPSPQSVYAETKFLGEYYVSHLLNRFAIVRISRVFGRSGRNFSSVLPRLMKEGKKIILTDNLVNSPTYADDLVKAMSFLVEKEFCGIVNVCNRGECSWYQYGMAVKDMMGIENAELVPVKFEGFKKGQAERPRYSVLSTELLETLGFSMPGWQDSLRRYLVSGQYISSC